MSGQQLLCIHNVLDSAPSSAHLHLLEQKRLLFVCSSTQVPQHNYHCRYTGTSESGVMIRVRVQVGVLRQPCAAL